MRIRVYPHHSRNADKKLKKANSKIGIRFFSNNWILDFLSKVIDWLIDDNLGLFDKIHSWCLQLLSTGKMNSVRQWTKVATNVKPCEKYKGYMFKDNQPFYKGTWTDPTQPNEVACISLIVFHVFIHHTHICSAVFTFPKPVKTKQKWLIDWWQFRPAWSNSQLMLTTGNKHRQI